MQPSPVHVAVSCIALAAGTILISGAAYAQRFMSGSEVADMYTENHFCYGYSYTDRSTCNTLEVLGSRSRDQIRIVSSTGYRWEQNPLDSKSPEQLAEKIILNGTTYYPHGVIRDEQQTFTVTPDGLCRSKAQEVSDAMSLRARYYLNRTVYSEKNFEAIVGEPLESRSRMSATRAVDQIGSSFCYRFQQASVDSNQYKRLSFSYYIDGIKQPDTLQQETIWLIPRYAAVFVRQK